MTAIERAAWRARNATYYRHIESLATTRLSAGERVLDLACDLGDLLASLRPSVGLGIDRDPDVVAAAARRFPDLRFAVAEPDHIPVAGTFDAILLPNVVGKLADVHSSLAALRAHCHENTRLFITYYNFVWEPVLKIGERIGKKQPEPDLNWLGMPDLRNLVDIAGYRILESKASLLLPRDLGPLSSLARWAERWSAVRAVCLVHHVVATPRELAPRRGIGCSVIVPVRNEVGNIAACIERVPRMGEHTEIVFVDGASTDGTRERIIECARGLERPGIEVRLIDQVAPGSHDPVAGSGTASMLKLGKGDAVRRGFEAAREEALVILDGDLTVPPEDLPKFHEVLDRGEGDFVNGSRLVYPLEEGAMRTFNLIANRLFGIVFSWILGQRVKDTLCGTKALRREDYARIVRQRGAYAFDPFGDFDLLFGAAQERLRIVEVPVRYRRRVYGHTKIRVIEHGLLLARMTLVGAWKLRLRPVFGRTAGAQHQPTARDPRR